MLDIILKITDKLSIIYTKRYEMKTLYDSISQISDYKLTKYNVIIGDQNIKVAKEKFRIMRRKVKLYSRDEKWT